jgi:ERCC4-related helicase
LRLLRRSRQGEKYPKVEIQNVVALPTALGKTVISALAAAHFLYNYKQC